MINYGLLPNNIQIEIEKFNENGNNVIIDQNQFRIYCFIYSKK